MKPAKPAKTDPMRPRSLVIFIALVLAWSVVWSTSLLDDSTFRPFARLSGYLAFFCLLIPYIHIGRRFFRFWDWWSMATWMRWHIVTAYLAFFFVLLHSCAHANGWFTASILYLLWIVMLSGVVAFYGPKLVYRLLALVVSREIGLEQMPTEARRLLQRAEDLIDHYYLVVAEEIRDWQALCGQLLKEDKDSTLHQIVSKYMSKNVEERVRGVRDKTPPETETEEERHQCILDWLNGLVASGAFSASLRENNAVSQAREVAKQSRAVLDTLCPKEIGSCPPLEEAVEAFFRETIHDYLEHEAPSWRWLFTKRGLGSVPLNYYTRAKELAPPRQDKIIDELWTLTQLRRQMDLEFWFHRVGRVWLLFHAPAAAVLLLLVIDHIIGSMRFGGF
jgi:hypothetical protein